VNPYGIITDPFASSTIRPGGSAAAPTHSTAYTVWWYDVLITSTGGTGVSISIIDPVTGNNVASGLTALNSFYLPVGYKINWGAFTAAPTVTVAGI
jgi:hypothetical protein